MITIFHGDNQVLSRQSLPEEARRFDAAVLTPEKIEQLFTSNEMFAEASPVIIFNLFKSPLLAQVAKHGSSNIYLWEPKKLSASQLKKVPSAKIREFKLPQALWRFLNTLRLTDLHETLKTQPVELVWYLLHRQAAKKQNLTMLKKMFAAELAVKSGQSLLDQKSELEFILMGL